MCRLILPPCPSSDGLPCLVEGIGIDDFEQVEGIFQPVHGLQLVQGADAGGNQRADGLGQV
ncbi:hypothetical protein [Neisseria lactamica]|uniref:hypothetical protein n=1 Tax=Neisseria lactamica TaxID=486 RepID=UPI0013B37ACE|nr:hypothetical protein [Neisseria lactamica]